MIAFATGLFQRKRLSVEPCSLTARLGDLDSTVCAEAATAIAANANRCRLRARLMPIMMTRRCGASWALFMVAGSQSSSQRADPPAGNGFAGKNGADSFFEVRVRRLWSSVPSVRPGPQPSQSGQINSCCRLNIDQKSLYLHKFYQLRLRYFEGAGLASSQDHVSWVNSQPSPGQLVRLSKSYPAAFVHAKLASACSHPLLSFLGVHCQTHAAPTR